MRACYRIIVCLLLGPGLAWGQSRPATAPASQGGNFLEEKYDSGQLKARYTIQGSGVKNGPYEMFYPNGKSYERGTYANGQLDGVRQGFHLNGQLRIWELYKNGKLDAASREYDDSGTLTRQADYRMGTLWHEARFKGPIPVMDRTFVDNLLVYPRSKLMIQSELDRIDHCKVETIPSPTSAPAFEDEETPATREHALRALMKFRYLCDVPYEHLKLDADYSAHAAAAANLCCAIGHLDHMPANPGWPDDRYQFALVGTSRGNLHNTYLKGPLAAESVDSYMDDTDAGNIDRVGHRRWCLDPYLGKTGFGTLKHFSAMYVVDHSNKDIPPFDFISYPAPGLFPVSHFTARRAWSISLNPEHYTTPNSDNVKVTLTPVQVQVEKNTIVTTGDAWPIEYLHVDLGPSGEIPICIIFVPTKPRIQPNAAYMVEVTGLKTTTGDDAPLKYVVEFFKP